MAAKKGDKCTNIRNESTLANFIDRNNIFGKCVHYYSHHRRCEGVRVNIISSGSVGAVQFRNDAQEIFSQ